MTYFITAYNNASQRLIESETRTTDPVLADVIAAHLEARGFYVRRWSES